LDRGFGSTPSQTSTKYRDCGIWGLRFSTVTWDTRTGMKFGFTGRQYFRKKYSSVICELGANTLRAMKGKAAMGRFGSTKIGLDQVDSSMVTPNSLMPVTRAR
jgi:hypothetical protein